MDHVKSAVFAFAAFTFDSGSGDLTSEGTRVRLPEQPARLLAVLLDQPGEVVTREELRLLLWSGQEYVDFDQGINNAVRKLRTALGDDPRSPVLLETIPKRGYRLLAEVKVLESEGQKLEAGSVVQLSGRSADRGASPETVAGVPEGETALVPPRPSRASLFSRSSGRFGRLSWVVTAGVVLVAMVAFLFYARLRQVSPNGGVITLGIVPFDTDGDTSEQLGESFRMDLMDAMSEVPLVQVRAAQSLGNVKENDASIRALSGKVQLDALLFGHLILRGNNFVLRMELVRARDAVHLASLQYQGTKAELASVREKAQSDIYTQLRLVGQPVQQMKGSTASPQAYETYLRARYQLSQRTDESTKKALEEFGTAVTEDSHFARAYAGMATTYLIRADYGFAPARESYGKAEQLAKRSFGTGPSIAEAHGVLGYALFQYDWNPSLAESELRSAIELEPNSAIYHVWFAVLLSDEGRADESFREIDLAHTSDPLWPMIYGAETFVACNARDHARELAAGRKLLELRPDWPTSHDELGWALWHAKRYPEAIAEWKKMAVLENDKARADLEDEGLDAFRRGGIREYAHHRLLRMKAGIDMSHHPNDFSFPEWCVYAGDREDAIAELSRMIAAHNPEALDIAVNPAYDDLRDDPRFKSLLSRIGFTAPPSTANN